MIHNLHLRKSSKKQFYFWAWKQEGITEYIARKREMFHVKYAISVKREEMRQLEKLAREEEKKLVIAEKCLEEDAVSWNCFALIACEK